MQLRLIREPSIDGATHGVLFVNGHYLCFTLEDQIRELAGFDVSQWKVPGATAIPAGRYQVVITDSQRFGRPLPLVVDVPGFAGIRFHPGNEIADTEGCPLPGLDRQPGCVLRSRLAFELLYSRIQDGLKGGGVTLTIENPPYYG